jgi:hypothetical protein
MATKPDFVPSAEDPNVLEDRTIDPKTLTEDQLDAIFQAQRAYGLAMSHRLTERFQRALTEWALELNSKGEPISAIATYYALAGAASCMVNILSLQLRANGGYDNESVLRWYAEVGNMAYHLVQKFMDPELRARDTAKLDPANMNDIRELRERDTAECAKLEEEQKRHAEAIIDGVRTGKLVGAVGHA